MSEIEKMQKYIERTKEVNHQRPLSAREVRAMLEELGAINAVLTAFRYGQSKGYRAAKAEVRG